MPSIGGGVTSILQFAVGELEINVRTANALIKSGCKNVGDVVGLGLSGLSYTRGIGPNTLSEILTAFRAMGIDLEAIEAWEAEIEAWEAEHAAKMAAAKAFRSRGA